MERKLFVLVVGILFSQPSLSQAQSSASSSTYTYDDARQTAIDEWLVGGALTASAGTLVSLLDLERIGRQSTQPVIPSHRFSIQVLSESQLRQLAEDIESIRSMGGSGLVVQRQLGGSVSRESLDPVIASSGSRREIFERLQEIQNSGGRLFTTNGPYLLFRKVRAGALGALSMGGMAIVGMRAMTLGEFNARRQEAICSFQVPRNEPEACQRDFLRGVLTGQRYSPRGGNVVPSVVANPAAPEANRARIGG